jgi:hypothetical protein
VCEFKGRDNRAVGAWIFVAAACVLVSRRLRPRAFAP